MIIPPSQRDSIRASCKWLIIVVVALQRFSIIIQSRAQLLYVPYRTRYKCGAQTRSCICTNSESTVGEAHIIKLTRHSLLWIHKETRGIVRISSAGFYADVEGVRNLVEPVLPSDWRILTAIISLFSFDQHQFQWWRFMCLLPVVIFGLVSLKAFGKISQSLGRGKINAQVPE